MNLRDLAEALEGRVFERRLVIAPWPDAPNGQFRQLWAKPHPLGPDGFVAGPYLGGSGTPKEAHAYVLGRVRRFV
jgi:hypothetical protein